MTAGQDLSGTMSESLELTGLHYTSHEWCAVGTCTQLSSSLGIITVLLGL